MPRLLALCCAVFLAASAFAQYDESIDVSRVLLDVRVTRTGGDPILDLTPPDFTVSIGGAAARVLSASWVDENSGAKRADELAALGADEKDLLLRPAASWDGARLVVVFVQTDFGRQPTRVRRQMGFNRYAEKIVNSFHPDDRVAVLSFDSHLKLRADFTRDRDVVTRAIRESIQIDHPAAVAADAEPSLAKLLDRDAMNRTTSSEQALTLLGEALGRIEGPKTLLLAGWGLGDKVGPILVMKSEWRKARTALLNAHATVFALNTGVGGELTAGLEFAAQETGGFHARTWEFPDQVVNRLERTMRGHYELELALDKPLAAGTHAIAVKVNRRGAIVLAATSITLAEQ
ncbi:MAG: hypothetical protein M3Q69_04465 [Acidobacteriota bacterium]|nr:hypothetical protein [Acidobacteriota bacterium]